MTALRMVNGADIIVDLTVAEVLEQLADAEGTGFVSLRTKSEPVHVRAEGVVAVVAEEPRGQAGFRTRSDG